MKHFIYQSLVAFAIALIFLFEASTPSQSMESASPAPNKVTFREYLDAVEKHSLDLQSQRENVTSAKAGISIAGVRPDPLLTAGIASKELSSANKPSASTATMVGFAVTLETAGKRGKRIGAAESNLRLTETSLAAFAHQLGLDSAAAFVEACRAREALARKRLSLEAFQNLVQANETRFKAGDIGLLELRQTRVEAERFAADVASATADAKAAEINLSTLLGKRFDEVFPNSVVDSVFKLDPIILSLDNLIRQALEKRDDILVAKAYVESTQAALKLAKANRWVDPTVNVGLTNTPKVPPAYDAYGNVTNSPAERSLALAFTVSIPIPFSRLQRGELIQAETAVKQAGIQLSSIQLKIQTEVRAIHTQYQAAAFNVQSYIDRVLKDADQVLEGTRKSYRLGSASLLELLSAQRTADDVYLGYLQALSNLANTTAKLQISVGMRPDL